MSVTESFKREALLNAGWHEICEDLWCPPYNNIETTAFVSTETAYAALRGVVTVLHRKREKPE